MAEPDTSAALPADRSFAAIVRLALDEDLADRGDITSQAIFSEAEPGAARVIVKEPCIVSGLGAAREVCRQVDSQLTFLPLVADGQSVPAGAEIIRLEGGVLAILTAERTLLNFLSRLSGIASYAARFSAELAGLPARLAATRKTDPGLRLAEKQAVVHGGGELHRLGLYDQVLIKDNHIAAAGGVTAAVERVRNSLGRQVPIEVEVDTEAQLEETAALGVNRILLDNMTPEQVKRCVALTAGRAEIEASGGIDLANIRRYGEAGADVISVGALTRAAPGIDFSLEMEG